MTVPILWHGEYDKVLGRAEVTKSNITLDITERVVRDLISTYPVILSVTKKTNPPGIDDEIVAFNISPVPLMENK